MAQIRNVALLSHSGAGKTSLLEAMLFRAGAIPKMGRIEDANTASDVTPEEKRRKVSIHSTVHPIAWGEHRFNVIDAPGYADFVGDIRGAMAAADGALVVVSAVSGVAVGTERVWTSATERELNTIVYVNKMDRENADFFRTMAALESSLPGNLAAVQVPIGQAEDFRGIVDLLDMVAYTWQGGERSRGPIPDEVAGVAASYRDRLVESIVETDDDLMMKYLEDQDLDPLTVKAAFFRAVRANLLQPVLCGSATEAMGITLLLDFLAQGVRDVEHHRPLRVASGTMPPLGLDGPFTARVFKTVVDPYLGKVSMMRVLSGSLKSGQAAARHHPGRRRADRPPVRSHGDQARGGPRARGRDDRRGHQGRRRPDRGHARRPRRRRGARPHPRPQPGDGAGAHPQDAAPTTTSSPTASPSCSMRTPRCSWCATPTPGRRCCGAWGTSTSRWRSPSWPSATGCTSTPAPPRSATARRSPARATPATATRSRAAAPVSSPRWRCASRRCARGSEFEFDWKVVGGTIPTQFQSSCEKGVRAGLTKGPLGFPMVDVRAEVYDGKDHPVDSKDIAFQAAAAEAFKEACSAAKPVLLEPLALVKVRVPDRFTGDVISDLNGRRGRVLGMDSEGSVSVISAHVPMSEVRAYSADLRSMTGGRGAFSLKLERYEPVPAHLVDKVLAEANAEPAAHAG